MSSVSGIAGPSKARSSVGGFVFVTLTELKQQKRWVLWKLLSAGGTETKIPFQRDGRHASSTDPRTWCTFAEAVAVVGSFSGVGVVLGNGLAGSDLDDCVDAAGQIASWAQEIIERFNSYAELSPSRTGIHILCWGELPGPGLKRPYGTGAAELYDRGRYLTFTGKPLNDREVEGRQDALDWLYALLYDCPGPTRPGHRAPGAIYTPPVPDFEKLAAGDWSGFPSQSEADFAFCRLLAERHHNDLEKMDAEFRESGLYREKWERRYYRERTLRLALTPPKIVIGKGRKS
jgi:primase-polymerase (primpol)-like protein